MKLNFIFSEQRSYGDLSISISILFTTVLIFLKTSDGKWWSMVLSFLILSLLPHALMNGIKLDNNAFLI